MSLLYKENPEIKVSITAVSGIAIGDSSYLKFEFSSDCGKFGTDEQLASFDFTPEELLKLFSQIEL